MCPNMNHFDAVHFRECHSEEMISFFWRSVYVHVHVHVGFCYSILSHFKIFFYFAAASIANISQTDQVLQTNFF